MADILSLLAGGLVALGGAYVGPFMQRVQRRDDRKSAHRAVIRERAERCLILTAKLRMKSRSYVLEVLEAGTTNEDSMKELHELFANLAVYFPDLVEPYTKWQNGLNKYMDDFVKGEGKKKHEEFARLISDQISELCGMLEKGIASTAAKNIDP